MERVKTARAVIEAYYNNEKCIVTIKRQKFKNGIMVKEYYTLPGGHVENDESFEEAVKREIFEELNAHITVKEKLLSLYNEDLNRDEEFFICEVGNEKIEKGNGPEWTNPDIEKYGSYEIVYVNIKEINDYNILPPRVKELLIKRYGV